MELYAIFFGVETTRCRTKADNLLQTEIFNSKSSLHPFTGIGSFSLIPVYRICDNESNFSGRRYLDADFYSDSLDWVDLRRHMSASVVTVAFVESIVSQSDAKQARLFL